MSAPTKKADKATLRSLSKDVRGAVSTEYLVLVGTVGLGMAFALFALGPGLVASYEVTRRLVAAP
ncbi:hypothetical protein [Chondromyces crocatus]|uniref:Uncharacterized protein n=1 Tax=Chondromyces crocatus TaxID=52 RepID=A0A0K1E768_CHOCO|nr:hypothetical protein [Chondromyces crocatus]AKT36532.1 uncharacterized protein CMC5_006480 [Chondromyces crocatus]